MGVVRNIAGKPEQLEAPRLWLLLARAHHSIAAYIEASFADRGFCLTDFMVLEALLHKGPLTISAIGEKILLASASMTSAIDRLEKRNLVRRLLQEQDRRVRLIDLTGEGRALIECLFAQHARDLEAIAGELSCEERRVLATALKKIGLAALDAHKDKSTPKE